MKMTVVRIGNKKNPFPLEFEFDEEMDAFNFYSEAKDHYRENDFIIAMTEEKEEEKEGAEDV
jgi:hypothetical protein